ncbi:MAG: fructosamine kinase family protein [Thiomicrorhabdus chilensis]|uniref:fructosamine kinase family protein n=1 Tax=Thiomicrorhabdus chilensis TaxID=63656 RepID=UPI00299CE3EC|nr:fructosamine kinase family protein [Thiomicrorhabdus chilensis]MDX1347943.1 fructosamine kinase family protein [Thiomicrorhabdus chilensis]
MNWKEFSHTLSQALSQSIHIETAAPVSGGDIHQAFKLHTHTGNYFLKLNHLEALPLFETEVHNLRAIERSGSILCPKPLGFGRHNEQAWLLMEHLELTSRGDDFQRGRDLALMHHQINHETKPFGWFENNYIGHTPQLNRWHSDWVGFYSEERLRPQLEMTQLNDAPRQLYDLGCELIDRLPNWFQNYQPEAALLHGDLWGGNSAFTTSGDAVVFDPACYYGDRETDLAMSELFGGFSDAFYAGYNEVFPLDRDYAKRKPLYNLYHILNHYNLFGGHYAQQAQGIIEQLLKQE